MAAILWKTIPVLLILLIWRSLYVLLRRMLGGSGKWRRLAALALSGCVLIPACNLWSSFYLLLLLLHLCVFLYICDGVDAILRRVGKGREKWQSLRQSLHRFAVIPLLCTAATALYGYVNIYNVVETEYSISTHKTIRAEGYRFALMADLHYGLLDNKASLQALADKLSTRNLDFVVIAGDMVDERTTLEQLREICSIMGGVRTNYGVFYVYGNHDTARYSHRAPFRKADLEAALRDNGITLLADSSVALGNELLLAGRQDKSDPRATTQELLQGAAPGRYIILADHQPYELADKAAAGVDLQLSGHTHSGQIFPVGHLCTLFNIGDQNYGHRTIGRMHSIVTSGLTGWGAPLRTQNRSEYVIIRLLGE